MIPGSAAGTPMSPYFVMALGISLGPGAPVR